MNALLIIAIALVIGGMNLLFLRPSTPALTAAAGSFMVFLGLSLLAAPWLKKRSGWKPLSNAQKMLLGGLSFLLALFGVAMTAMSAGDPWLGGSGLQTACFALIFLAAAASLFLLFHTQKEASLDGFSFITGESYEPAWGLTGLRHVYEGERKGIPLKVSVAVGAHDRHGTPRYVLRADCLVDNPHGVALLAHPERVFVVPPLPVLPRIPRVQHWERHVVRGTPPALVRRILAPFRKHHCSIFSEEYGFERVRVEGNRVRGRFIVGLEDKHQITDIIEGLVFFAGHFN